MTIPYVCLYSDYEQTLAPFSFEERGRLLTAMLRFVNTGEDPEFSGNERFIWPSIRGQMLRDQEAYERRCEQNRENGKKGGRPKKAAAETDGFSMNADEPEKPTAFPVPIPMKEETEGFSAEPVASPLSAPENDGLSAEQASPEKPAPSACPAVKTEKTEGFSEKPKKPNEKEKEKKNDNDNNNDNKNENEKKNEKPPVRREPLGPPDLAAVRAYAEKIGYPELDCPSFSRIFLSFWQAGDCHDWKTSMRNWKALNKGSTLGP